MKRSRLLIASLLLLATSAASAKAQDGLNGLGLGYLFGYNGGANYYRSFNATPPYFALHPPVYYGQRFARPYGVSPFAAWPQLQANASYAPQLDAERTLSNQPAVIVNPYVVPAADCATCVVQNDTAERPVAMEPLVIENPYFEAATRLVSAE